MPFAYLGETFSELVTVLYDFLIKYEAEMSPLSIQVLVELRYLLFAINFISVRIAWLPRDSSWFRASIGEVYP